MLRLRTFRVLQCLGSDVKRVGGNVKRLSANDLAQRDLTAREQRPNIMHAVSTHGSTHWACASGSSCPSSAYCARSAPTPIISSYGLCRRSPAVRHPTPASCQRPPSGRPDRSRAPADPFYPTSAPRLVLLPLLAPEHPHRYRSLRARHRRGAAPLASGFSRATRGRRVPSRNSCANNSSRLPPVRYDLPDSQKAAIPCNFATTPAP